MTKVSTFKDQSAENLSELIQLNKTVVKVFSELEPDEERSLWARASANPLVYFEAGKNMPMAVGAFADNRARIVVEKIDGKLPARITTVSDMGVNIGFGFTGPSNRLTFGLHLRPLMRYGYSGKLSTEDVFDTDILKKHVEKNATTSKAVGIDVGMMVVLADYWFPTLGVAVLNVPTGCEKNFLNPYSETRQTICGTKHFGTNDSIYNPDTLYLIDPTELRVGLSITPRLTRKFAIRFAADLHNLYVTDGKRYYGYSDIGFQKIIHTGAEMFIGNPLLRHPLSLRAGYGQGFFSMGASLQFYRLNLSVATYSKDISQSVSPKPDKRTIVAISFEI